MKKLWKKFGTKSVNFFLALTASGGLIVSCGHRKTESFKTEINKDTLISILNEKKIKVDSNYTFDFSTFKIYPIDFSKPISLDGRIIDNASIEGTKKIGSGSVKKNIISKEKEIKKSITSQIIKNKESKKSDNTLLYIGLFFVFCLFIFAWFKLPSFKKDI